MTVYLRVIERVAVWREMSGLLATFVEAAEVYWHDVDVTEHDTVDVRNQLLRLQVTNVRNHAVVEYDGR